MKLSHGYPDKKGRVVVHEHVTMEAGLHGPIVEFYAKMK